jgi:hypothetical protein
MTPESGIRISDKIMPTTKGRGEERACLTPGQSLEPLLPGRALVQPISPVTPCRVSSQPIRNTVQLVMV